MTTDNTRLPVIATAVAGWRLGLAAMARMPGLMGFALLGVWVLNHLNFRFVIGPLDSARGLGVQALTLLIAIAQAFLLTPVAIAVHRYVLLGEVQPGAVMSPYTPRFLNFFLFAVVFQFLFWIPGVFALLTGDAGLLVTLLDFILLVVVIIVTIRLVILFPAIAVDAPAADWRHALRDSRGHSWQLFFIVLITGLPLVVIYLPLFWLLLWPGGPSSAGGFLLSGIVAVLSVASIAAYAAVASRLYLAFADQLGRPPGLPSPADLGAGTAPRP